MPWFILMLVIAALALVYVQARAAWWLAVMIVWVGAAHVSGAAGPVLTTLFAIVFVLPALVLTLKPLRRAWLTKPVLGIFRKILPEMSPTEQRLLRINMNLLPMGSPQLRWRELVIYGGHPWGRVVVGMQLPDGLAKSGTR